MRTKMAPSGKRTKLLTTEDGRDEETEEQGDLIDSSMPDASLQSEDTIDADEVIDDIGNQDQSCWIVLPPTKDDFITIRCKFENCDQMFHGLHNFRSHFVEMHWPAQQYVVEGVEGHCGVAGCHFAYTDMISYRRHLTFHIYHATLQNRGAQVMLKSGCQCLHSLDDANNVYYNGDPLECSWNECGRTFDDVAEFFEHVSYHGKTLEEDQRSEKEQKFLCLWKDCTYGTRRKYEVTGHLRHHSGEKLVSCPTCGAFFANSTKLVDHCARQTTSESSRLRCLLCNKIFPSERLLRDHGRRHINNYKCPFCEMSLPTPSTLRWHVMHRHTQAAPHVCITCSKGFKSALDLERHFSKHQEGVEHECRVCGKKFKWLQSLQNHERQHYQVEMTPYLCHLCPKKYRQGAFLSQHFVKIHKMSLPAGHSRFTYKKCADGYFRVLTERYESAELQETAPDDQTVSVNE